MENVLMLVASAPGARGEHHAILLLTVRCCWCYSRKSRRGMSLIVFEFGVNQEN